MSDNITSAASQPTGPATIVEVLDGVEPMGDLSRFAIGDLTPEDEDEFFSILERA